MTNLALILQNEGEFDKAEKILRRVLALRTESSGPEHPSTVLILRRLVELFDAKGDKDSLEATTLRLKGVGIRQQVLLGELLSAGLLFD